MLQCTRPPPLSICNTVASPASLLRKPVSDSPLSRRGPSPDCVGMVGKFVLGPQTGSRKVTISIGQVPILVRHLTLATCLPQAPRLPFCLCWSEPWQSSTTTTVFCPPLTSHLCSDIDLKHNELIMFNSNDINNNSSSINVHLSSESAIQALPQSTVSFKTPWHLHLTPLIPPRPRWSQWRRLRRLRRLRRYGTCMHDISPPW